MKYITLPFVLVSLLCLTACTTDQITLTLELAVDAAATVASVAAPQDVAFINLASTCLNAATMELDSTDTNLQKGTVILGECAQVEAGAAGLSPLGVALSNAIANFLIHVKSLEAFEFSHQYDKFVNAYANSTDARIDKKRLERIKKKLAKLPVPKGGK